MTCTDHQIWFRHSAAALNIFPSAYGETERPDAELGLGHHRAAWLADGSCLFENVEAVFIRIESVCMLWVINAGLAVVLVVVQIQLWYELPWAVSHQ